MTIPRSSAKGVLALVLVLAASGGLAWYLLQGGTAGEEGTAPLGPLGENRAAVPAPRGDPDSRVEPLRPIPLPREEVAQEMRAREVLRQLRDDPRSARLEGWVENPEGARIPGAEVVVYELSGSRPLNTVSDPEVARVRSADRGGFQIAPGPLRGGLRYALEVTHPDYAPVVVPGIDPLDPGSLSQVVVLGPGLSIRGRVSQDGGTPLAGAEIVVFSEDRTAWEHGHPFEEARAESDAEGRYEVARLTPGTKRVTARHPGLVTRSRGGVRLTRGVAPPSLDFVLAPGTAIAGRVIDERTGGGVAGITVFVAAARAESEGVAGLFAATEDSGHFRIDGLRAGTTYVLRVQGDGVAGAPVRNVTPGDEDLLIRLSFGASVSGEVVDAATGAPIESFVLSFCPAPRLIASAGARGQRFEDPHGRFTLRGAPPGTQYLAASAPGYCRCVYGPVEVDPDGQVGGHRIALERGAEVLGRIVDRGGSPIPGVAVWLDELVPAPRSRIKDGLVDVFEVPRHQAASLDDGSFIAVGVTMGRYRVRVTHPGHAPATSAAFEVSSAGETLIDDVVLEAAAGVEGVVREGGGTPDPRALVRISEIGNEREGVVVPTDGEGRFKLTGLRAGAYEIRLVRHGGKLVMASLTGGAARGVSRRVTLIAGEIKEVELRGP